MTRCGVTWAPTAQAFYVGAVRYKHDGPTNTYPSHDIAHVLVGATSALNWLPANSDSETRLAEFNAVVCEAWLNNTFSVIYTGHLKLENMLEATLEHARWFAEEYYHPFPVSWRTACARFAQGINVDSLVALSPVFLKQRWQEVANGETDRIYRFRFATDGAPSADQDMLACQRLLREQWSLFRDATTSMRCAGPESGH